MKPLGLKRALLAAIRPGRVWGALRRGGRARESSVWNDPQLQLYADIFRNDMLHYGYFADPTTPGERISIADLEAAQGHYAALIADAVRDSPVLDVGCGMGGIARLLADRGHQVVALTPSRPQVEYVRRRHPEIPVIAARFQDYPDPEPRYGTVLMAESFQYLRLDAAFDMVDRLLLPGGRWVICDYFCVPDGDGHERSGHLWTAFAEGAAARGWEVVERRDITDHVLPSLRYIHVMATRFGRPLVDFAGRKLEIKRPRLAYLLEDLVRETKAFVDDHVAVVDPERFAAGKRYLLLVLRRRGDAS